MNKEKITQRIFMALKSMVISWQGKPATLTVMRDISSRIRNRAALAESEQRLAAVAGEALVLDFIEANAGLFRLRDPRSELVPTETQIDASGDEHVRLEHYYKGVPIWGSQLVGHTHSHAHINPTT